MPRTGKGQVAPGEPYGQRAQLEEQMAAAPMPEGGDHLHGQAVASAAAMPPPPGGGLLKQPSARPNEPVTAGLPIGAGPGPEVMGNMQNHQTDRLRTQLQMAAEITGNPRIARMVGRMYKRPQ